MSATTKPLTEFQKQKLEMMKKGYALDASPREWKASERQQLEDLVSRGLARRMSATKWAKHGAYVWPD